MSAAKQRRYRERKDEGLHVLKGHLAVNGESLVRLAEAGLLPFDKLMTDDGTLQVISALLDFCAADEPRKKLAESMLAMIEELGEP